MYRSDINSGKSRYAVLGLLSIRPMSGYDIKKTVEESLAHFWKESYGSIYPVLKRLAAEGLVERVAEKGARARDRFVYTLTARGRDTLAEWLVRPPEDEPPIRSELLLKLFFGNLLPSDHLISLLAAFRDRQREIVERLRTTEREVRDGRLEESGAFYWLLTLRRGILIAAAREQWAAEAIAEIQAAAARSPRRRRKTVRPQGADTGTSR